MSGDVHVRFRERLGVRFPRATRLNVYVRSVRAGQRVMASLTAFITRRLKLKVDTAKSAVVPAWALSFLGFGFTGGSRPKRRLAASTVLRFRKRVRVLTRRVRGVSLHQMVRELSAYLLGWRAYFGYCQTPTVLRRLGAWIRRRLRAAVWKQWQRPGTRFRELRKRGVNAKDAILTARSNRGPWRATRTAALCWALPGAYFASLGLPHLERPLTAYPAEQPWYGPVCPVVWEGRRREASPYPDVRQAWRAAPCLALSTGRRKPTGK